MAILKTLLMQDAADEEEGKANTEGEILTTLQREIAQADEFEDMDEILDAIENFMETYKRQASSNTVDHSELINGFKLSLKKGGFKSETLYHRFLDGELRQKIKLDGPVKQLKNERDYAEENLSKLLTISKSPSEIRLAVPEPVHIILQSDFIKTNVTKSYSTQRFCMLTSTELLVYNS